MAEVINLRQRRKARARDEKRARGTQNAARFGRTAAQIRAEEAEAARNASQLDAHQREGRAQDILPETDMPDPNASNLDVQGPEPGSDD